MRVLPGRSPGVGDTLSQQEGDARVACQLADYSTIEKTDYQSQFATTLHQNALCPNQPAQGAGSWSVFWDRASSIERQVLTICLPRVLDN